MNAIWAWILWAAPRLSENPAVRAWVAVKAGTLIALVKRKAEARIAALQAASGIHVSLPISGSLVSIATNRDCLRPGQLLELHTSWGASAGITVARLVSSDAQGRSLYEARVNL